MTEGVALQPAASVVAVDAFVVHETANGPLDGIGSLSIA